MSPPPSSPRHPVRAHPHYGPAGRASGRGRPFAFQVVLVLSTSESIVVACALRSALARPCAQGGERACNTALSVRPSASSAVREKAKQLHREQKRLLFLSCSGGKGGGGGERTAHYVPPPQPEIAAGEPFEECALPPFPLLSLSPSLSPSSCHSTPLGLPRRDGSAKGRPSCRNGQSCRRRRRSLGGKIECCCHRACWSAGVVALLTSCMVSCRYVVVFA